MNGWDVAFVLMVVILVLCAALTLLLALVLKAAEETADDDMVVSGPDWLEHIAPQTDANIRRANDDSHPVQHRRGNTRH